jgi:hypothetical protein
VACVRSEDDRGDSCSVDDTSPNPDQLVPRQFFAAFALLRGEAQSRKETKRRAAGMTDNPPNAGYLLRCLILGFISGAALPTGLIALL